MYLESVAQFNWVPPPGLQQWLPSRWLTSFNGHGFLYLCGLITFGGAWLPLARPDLEENARSILAFGLLVKAFFIGADVRLWSGNEIAHLAAGWAFLSGGRPLLRVRCCLGLVAVSGAVSDLWLQGWSWLVAVQALAAAGWLAGGRYWKLSTGALFLGVGAYGMIGISYRMVILLPLVLVCAGSEPAWPRSLHPRYAVELVLTAFCLLALPSGLMMLGPNRVPIRVLLAFGRGSEQFQLTLRYPRRREDFTDSRVGISRIFPQEKGRRRRVPVQEPLVADGVVLFEPSYFNQRPEALRMPYLYRFYAQELERRWHPEQLTVRASWGSIPLYDRRVRPGGETIQEESDDEAEDD